MDPIASAVERGLNYAARIKEKTAHAYVRAYDPRIPVASNHQGRYAQKARTVIALLERYKPRSIIELGSGDSSAWFAAYAAKHPGTTVLSVDESEEWQHKQTETARRIGGVEFRVAAKVFKPPNGYHYDIDLPPADFVFMDGPYHHKHEAGLDVPRMIERGHRPKVICVDGRTTGVDLIRTLTPDYDFHPQMIYCLERRMLTKAIAMNAQSVFVRR